MFLRLLYRGFYKIALYYILSKNTLSDWKNKNVALHAEIRKLKKDLSQIRISRDNWKEKYYNKKTADKQLASKPSRHHYPTSLIWLCMYLYTHSQSSFRSCCTLLYATALLLNIKCRKPSASTLRNWVIKNGYHAYVQASSKEDNGNWCIIIDESVSIGQEKLLLVLGLRLNNWQFNKAISHQDVSVLYIGIASSWKSEAIEEVLIGVAKKVKVSYCVSDRGNNIRSAIKKIGMLHIFDCSHEFAGGLESIYGKDDQYMKLMKTMGMLKKKWVVSKYAHLMPPKQRTKARFQNSFPLIDWIEKLEKHWNILDPHIQKELSFLKDNEALIADLILLRNMIKEMSSILKKEGMNKDTLQQCRAILEAGATTENTRKYGLYIQKLWLHYDTLLKDNTFICCSDIIESYFGRYKQKIKSNGMQAITETVLEMCMWGQEITQASIKIAMETVKLKDVEVWKQENTTPSILQIRKKFFQQKGTKMAA